MEEKYLYGGKVYTRSQIESSAKQNGLAFDDYVQQTGCKKVEDKYEYNGSEYGVEDVLKFQSQSGLEFDDYLIKTGIKPVSITPAAQPVIGSSDVYQNLGIERNEAAKILTGDGTIASPTPEYKFKDPWKQKVYDATKAEILSLEKQVKESPIRDFTAEKELEKKKRQLEKAVVNEQFENKDEYIGLYDIQEKKKVAVPKSDVPTMMNNFIRESKLNERGEEFVVPFEKMNPDAQRVVLYNFNQKYMTPDKLDDFLKEHNYTTEGGGERKLKNAVQNIESGVMEGVGSFVEYYGQQLNHPLKDGINQLVLEASIGAVTEKEFNDRLNNLVSSAEKDPSYGSRAAQSVAELSTPINAGAHPLQAMMSLTKNDIHETVFGAAKAEFEQIKANLPTWKSAQESDGVFYKDQLGDDTIEQAKGIADFGKNWLKTNPKYNEELLYGVAPKALGSSIPFLAIGAATGATGYQFLSTATMAMLGHHQMAVQGYNEAIQAGGTARDAIMSSLVNGGMGMTEAIPIADLYTRLAKGSSGRLWNVLIQGSEEATQETLQQVVGNVSAKTLYDDSRSIMDGVVESVQASFLVGGLMGGLIYNKREGASKSDLALLDKLDEQRKIALQNINDAPKGSAVNLATGEIVTPEEITLGKTENETSFRDALEEDVLATEPVVQPESLDEIPDGWDVSYQGISGTLVRGEDGLYIRTDDNVDILVEGGLSDSTPEELGLKVSQPVTKATVRAKTRERTRNYNVKYKDGNEYFVSLDDPNNPDGFGDKVFKVNGDGTMTEMFYGRKANVNKKLAIINKALDASGLPARNSEVPSVEEKNILDKEAEAEEKKAKEPKKEGEKKQPEEDKTEPTQVVINTEETPEAAIKSQSGIKSAAEDNSIPNRVQGGQDVQVDDQVDGATDKKEVVKKQQKAQKKSTTKKKTNNPEVTKEVKKTRSANTLVGGDTVYNVDVAEDGFTDIEDLKSYMKENPDAEDVTITQELHDTIWPKKKSDPTLVTKEAHDKKFTDDIRLLETTKEVDKKATGMYGRITDAEEKGYITPEEAEAQRKQVADLVTKRRKMEDIEQIDKMLKSEAIKALQRLKFKNDSAPDKIYSMIIPLPTTKQAKAAWNAAMDIAIAAVKVGTKIIDAVNAAIEYLTDKGYKITGKQKADLLKNIEKEAGVYSPKNKVQLQRVLEKIFNLSSKQAALVADVADRMAVAYQNMGVIAEKNDYYTYLLPGISEAKNLDEALYQVGKTLDPNIEIINGFYSPIQKRLLEQKQDKFSAKKWMEIVGNKDEAKFTGVYDMLAAKKPDEQVSRNEIMQWMKDNRIEIKEVVKGRDDKYNDKLISLYEKYDVDSMSRLINVATKEDIAELDDLYEGESNQTKFSQYQLEGEKTGYKEVLITLPSKQKPKTLVESLQAEKSQFKSSHFDEPNILVHLRMNIRTSATGEKILFLEEIQSDWGQKGKKGGFAKKFPLSEKEAERYAELGKHFTQSHSENDVIGGKMVKDMTAQEEQVLRDEFYNLRTKYYQSNAVAPAPFVTDTNSWVKLGLKFALQHAIKEGATSIAWTTGEQQNERYDLSKQIDAVEYQPQRDGKFDVFAHKGDNHVFHEKGIDLKRIEDVFGKEVADKISKNEGERATYDPNLFNKKLSGDNLKVGGKGMIGFYGSPTDGKLGIVGNVAESLFGKGSVKTSEISVTTDVKYISFADAMKAFREGGAVYTESNDGSEREIEEEIEIARAEDNNQKFFLDTAGDSQKSLQPSITITPEMKAEVERGLPLFQGEKGYFLPSQRVIGAINNPDISSPLHELSHAFFDDVIKLMTQGNDMAFELFSELREFAMSEEGRKFWDEWNPTYNFGEEFSPTNYVFMHELFAKGFEQYLTTGKSNAGENVKGLFEAIKDFMLEIYNGIVEATLDINLSPKMISVYDKMMGLDVGYFKGEEAEMVAYHRSPSKFYKFKTSNISADSNRQRYGYGLHFSNIIPIKEYGEYLYKVKLFKGKKEYVLIDTKKPVEKDTVNKIVQALDNYNKKSDEVVEFAYNGWLFYKTLSRILGGDKQASLFLSKNGIDGLKVSQAKNFDDYVLFNEDSISIEEINEQPIETTPTIDTSSIVLKQASKKTTSTFGLNTKQWNKMLSDIQNDYKIGQDINQSIDNVVNLLTGSVDKVALAADLKNVLSSPEAMSRKSFSLLRQDVKSMLRGARDEKARMAEVRSVLADWIRMNRKQLNSAGAKLTTSVINRVNNIKREIDVDNTIDYLQRILDDADFRRLEQQREKAKAKLLFLLDPKTYVFKKNSVARGKKVDADTIDYLTKLHYNAVNMSRIAAITRMNDIVAALSGSGTLNNSPFFPTPQQISELQQELIDISFSGAEDMDLSELDVAIQAAEDIVEQGKQALNTEKEARKKERADFKAKMLEVFTNKGQAKKVDGPNMVQDFFIKEGNDFHSIQDRLSVHEKDTDTMNSTLEKKHGRAARNAETGENIDQLKLFKEIGKKITSILGDAAVNYGGGKGVKAAMLKSRQFAKIFKRMAVQNYLKAMAENMNVISYNDAAGNARTEELTMNQIAYAWGLWKNSESRENLKVEGVQRGQEFYDAIDQRLPQVMKDYVDYVMNELMPSMHPYLNSVYKQMYGLNLTKLDNYLPQRVINRPDSTKSYDLWDEFSMGNISPSAVKSRISHGQELAILDINKVIQQYVTQAIKFKHWAIPVKEMMLFYNDQDVMKAINEYHGNVYNQMINVYLQHWKGATFNIGLKLIDKFRKNTTIGLLGLKPVIAVYQMANMPSYMAAIPVAQYAKLSGKIFSGVWDGDTRAKIGYLLDSDYFQQRFNSGDMYEVRELMDRTKVKLLNGKLTYSEMMTFMIRLGDAGAIVFGGYPVFEHNYRKAKKNGATDAEAKKIGIDAWADATEYLQQSSASSRRSSIEFNPWVKLMTMFASQPRQYHRLAVSAARNLIAGRGDTKHNLKTLFVCHVMMPSLYQLAANGFDWDNDDQLTAALIGNLNSIIILGQLINSASLMINDRQAFDINSPVLSMFQNLMFAFQKMLTANDESKDWDSDDTAQTIYLFTRGLTPVIPLPTGAGSNYWKLYQEKKEGGDVYREPFRLGGWSQDNLEHTDRAKKILLESRQEEQKKQLIEDDKWQEDMVWSTNNNKWMNGFAKQKSDAWFRTKKAYDEKIDQTDFYYDADADMWYKKE